MHGGPLLHQQAFLQSADLLVKAANAALYLFKFNSWFRATISYITNEIYL